MASVITMIFYYRNLKSVDINNRNYEQSMIWKMSIFVMLSNDPVAVINVLRPNLATLFLICIILGIFIVLLFEFWLNMLKRIVDEGNSNVSAGIPSWLKVYLWTLFAFNLIAVMILNYVYVYDPAYDLEDERPTAFHLFQLIIGVMLIALGVYMFVHLFKICKVWRNRLARHKTFLLFSLYFMFAIIIILAPGWSHYHSKNGPGILISITLYNVYIWCLQYLYCYSGTGQHQNYKFQENERNFQKNRQYAYMDNLEDPASPPPEEFPKGVWAMDKEEMQSDSPEKDDNPEKYNQYIDQNKRDEVKNELKQKTTFNHPPPLEAGEEFEFESEEEKEN